MPYHQTVDLRSEEPSGPVAGIEDIEAPTVYSTAQATMPVVHYPSVSPALLADGDLGWLVELLCDPDIAWYEPLAVPLGSPEGLQLVKTFIHRSSDPASPTDAWTVLERGQRVGVCQLRRRGEGYLVGVSLQPDVRNRGLGTALFKALAVFGVHTRGAAFVAGEVEDANIASLKAIQRAGYVVEDRYPITLDNDRPTTVTRFVARSETRRSSVMR